MDNPIDPTKTPEFKKAAHAIYNKTFTHQDVAEIKKQYQTSFQKFTIPETEKYVKPRLDWLLEVTTDLPKESLIADLGSCTGTLANALTNCGFPNVTCVELATTAVEHGQYLFPHLDWINDDIETWVPDKDYDVFVLFEVLEHLPYHRATLRKYLSHLKTGGKILITVPIKSHIIRDFEENGHYDHLNYFEEEELADLGQVVSISSADGLYTWHAVEITK